MANNEKTPVQIPEWADSGAITTPTASQVQAGWIQGQRPFHFTMNWIQNIYAQKINYILARGIVDWVASNPYEQYALINYEGVIYRKKTAGTTTSSTTPDTDTTNWERNTPVFDVNPTPNTGALRGNNGEINANGITSDDDVEVTGDVIVNGDVTGNNLQNLKYDPQRTYVFGDTCITTDLDPSTGVSTYRYVWVNVKKDGFNQGNDPELVSVVGGVYQYFSPLWRREKIAVTIFAPATETGQVPTLAFNLLASGTSEVITMTRFTSDSSSRTYRWDSFKDADGNKFIEGTTIYKSSLDPSQNSFTVNPQMHFNGDAGSIALDIRSNALAIDKLEGVNILTRPTGQPAQTMHGLLQPMIWSSESSYRNV